MEKRFIRRKEDFTCQVCGTEVKGSGYTNHCPKCIWSKHVDVFPGDRKDLCQGLMEPVLVEMRGDEYVISHKCQKCGSARKNKASSEDDFEVLLDISRRIGND